MAGRPRRRGVPLPPAPVRGFERSAHDSNCKCPRCIGFQPGNEWALGPGNGVAIRHGAKVALERISGEANAIAETIREAMAVYHPVDEVAVRALSIVLVRIERAETALAARDAGEVPAGGKPVQGEALERNLRGWLETARRYLNDLGMTPGSRARLGLDIARARSYRVLDLHQEDSDDGVAGES